MAILPFHIGESSTNPHGTIKSIKKVPFGQWISHWTLLQKKKEKEDWGYTDLGSLIGNTQCGNFKIYLQLRLYVKSILLILMPKTALLNIWVTLDFEFLGTFYIFKCEIFPKSKLKASKTYKTAVFDLLKSVKIDFTKNQSGRKIAKFPHCGKSLLISLN